MIFLSGMVALQLQQETHLVTVSVLAQSSLSMIDNKLVPVFYGELTPLIRIERSHIVRTIFQSSLLFWRGLVDMRYAAHTPALVD